MVRRRYGTSGCISLGVSYEAAARALHHAGKQKK
jgi:hypothetical protein